METKVDAIITARLKDRKIIQKASAEIDCIREKFGKPEKGFDTVTILRKIRDSK